MPLHYYYCYKKAFKTNNTLDLYRVWNRLFSLFKIYPKYYLFPLIILLLLLLLSSEIEELLLIYSFADTLDLSKILTRLDLIKWLFEMIALNRLLSSILFY